MNPYYKDQQATLYLGDCRDVLALLPENSVDSIVTDPPYEIGFMGKKWDGSGIANDVNVWRAALRVLKPGGHLLAFSGARTYHRIACAIDDAGFEVRDQIMWVYSSGFPKSHNGVWGGTALKPAHEPICMARKPLAGTVAQNVAAHGTGGLSIDECRVPLGDDKPYSYPNGRGGEGWHGRESLSTNLDVPMNGNPSGRWPANLIHDGSDEVRSFFPDSNGQQGDLVGHSKDRKSKGIFGDMKAARNAIARVESDKSASRFFYCPKATKGDREEGNKHPTVKPTELMRYLCRLITPADGIVLDMFAGSGSTGKAAILEGFQFIGCDITRDYLPVQVERIKNAKRIVSEGVA